jgi:CRP-like cAMP-binding protein
MLSILNKLLKIPSERRTSKHLEQITEALKDIPVLTPHIEKPLFSVICRSIFIEDYESTKTIFNEGDEADKFYIILEGEVKVL